MAESARRTDLASGAGLPAALLDRTGACHVAQDQFADLLRPLLVSKMARVVDRLDQ